jgi:hypothetical protein
MTRQRARHARAAHRIVADVIRADARRGSTLDWHVSSAHSAKGCQSL